MDSAGVPGVLGGLEGSGQGAPLLGGGSGGAGFGGGGRGGGGVAVDTPGQDLADAVNTGQGSAVGGGAQDLGGLVALHFGAAQGGGQDRPGGFRPGLPSELVAQCGLCAVDVAQGCRDDLLLDGNTPFGQQIAAGASPSRTSTPPPSNTSPPAGASPPPSSAS